MEKINVKEKLNKFSEHWQPKIIGELNDSHIKVARLKGEFIWHHHESEDEMFYVIEGELKIYFRDRSVTLCENEFIIVPRGVEHKPVAEQEVQVMLVEAKTTVNTGNVRNERTVENPENLQGPC